MGDGLFLSLRLFAISRLRFLVKKVVVEREALTRVLKKFRPIDTGLPLIRVGPDGDGGYVMPDDLIDCVGLLSPGVGDIADFDLSFAQRGIKVVELDHTIESPPFIHELVEFLPLRLGASPGPGCKTIAELVTLFPASGDLVLQLDVEGDEWACLALVEPSILLRFRMLTVEFHRLDEFLTDPRLRTLAEAVLDRILENFVVAHSHVNNGGKILSLRERGAKILLPATLEVTFLRKDRLKVMSGLPAAVPNPLDYPNNAGRPESPIPFEWRG